MADRDAIRLPTDAVSIGRYQVIDSAWDKREQWRHPGALSQVDTQVAGDDRAFHLPTALPQFVRTNDGRIPAFLHDFYFRVHILVEGRNLYDLPLIALGNLITEQTRELEVWNAHMTDRTLEAIGEEGTEGLTLTADTPPATYRPLQSRLWETRIFEEGPPAIQAFYTLHWDDGTETVLEVTGTRVVTWTHPHNWREPIIERIDWLTGVVRAWDGHEAVTSLRNVPRRHLDQLATLTGTAAAAAEAKLWGWGGRVFAVPLWEGRTVLQSAAPVGAHQIDVATVQDREFLPGVLVLIWRAWNDYEIGEIADVDGTTIHLDRPLERSHSAGDTVVPTRLGRLPTEHHVDRYTSHVGDIPLSWELMDRSDLEPGEPVTLYRGREVFPWRPNWAETVPLEFERFMDRIDGDTGIVHYEDRSGRPRAGQRLQLLLRSRQEIEDFRRFLYRCRGRARPFWMPTRQRDLEPLEIIGSVATTFRITDIEARRFYGVTTGRRDLAVFGRGAPLYTRITAIEAGDPGEEVVHIDPPLGVTLAPDEIHAISFMALQRLASDEVEITHHTAGVAEAFITTRTLDHEPG